MPKGSPTKLTRHDVAMIRALLIERAKLREQVEALTTRKIAGKFEVHQSQITRIERSLKP